VCATDHEPFMYDERHIFVYIIVGLRLLEFGPLVGREKSILVGYLQVLAQQSKYLCLGAEWIITDHELRVLNF